MLRRTPSKTRTLRSEDRTRDTIVNLASAVQYAASSIYQHIEITSANAEVSELIILSHEAHLYALGFTLVNGAITLVCKLPE